MSVADAVQSVWSQLGLRPAPERRGPVLLGPLMDGFNLLHVALPDLTRGAVFDHLMAEGITPADVGDVDEPLAGFLFVTPSVGLVFVNASDPVQRQRFTAAHELGHFVLHRDAMGGLVSIGDTPATILEVEDGTIQQHEREANRFAAELLMPEEVCRARAGELQEQHGCCPRAVLEYRLAAELLVSVQAMRYRLRNLGVGDA